MTVRINKQKINLREKLAGVEEKVNFDEVVRGLGEYTGNVGIGTTNPVNALHVHGQVDGLGYIRITDGSTGSSAVDGARIGYNALGLRIQNYENTNISFFTNGTTEALTIKNDGDVGIGYKNPDAKLEVDGGIDDSEVFRGRSDGGNGNNARFSLKAFADGNGTYGGGLKIQTRDNVNIFHDRLTIKSNGNVGIGTTDPANYKLNVQSTSEIVPIKGYRKTTNSGSYLISLNSNVGGTDVGKFRVEADGDVISATNSYGSDERLKTEISDLGYGLDTINQLSPKQFKMLHSKEKGFKYGFIAQDVEDILPDIVRQQGLEDGEGGYYKALEYNSIIAVLTKAIQEQQTIINDLKSRIETLEQQ